MYLTLTKGQRTMRTNVYYSITNGGDGSAGIALMESKELASLVQEIDNEAGDGWAEDCSGWISIEHEGDIKILDTIETIDSLIKDIDDDYDEGDEYYPKKKMAALAGLKAKQTLKISAARDSIVAVGVDAGTATMIAQAITNGEIKNVSFKN